MHANCDECGVPDDLCNIYYECIADVWKAATIAAEEKLNQQDRSSKVSELPEND